MSPYFNIPGVDFDRSIPVMDREQIDMLLMVDDGEDDSTALVRELFDLFQGESADKLKDLDTVCAANDTEELRRMVHFIAGSAGNLGLARLSRFYREVEQAIDESRLTELSSCAKPIRTAFEEACAAFGAEFGI
jgi:HPt (histidine-containing phosphotransfer) domain-containing protein